MQIKAPCPFQPRVSNQVEGGFHCNKCQRKVHDMRGQEIIDWSEWENGRRCGIFREDQLETVPFSKWKKIYFQWLIFISFLGWNAGPVQAQTTEDPPRSTKTERLVVNKNKVDTVSVMPKKIHWWQFMQKRKLR